MHKRLVAFLLAMVMTVTPFISFAAEETGTEQQAPAPPPVEQVEEESTGEEPAEELDAKGAEAPGARGAGEPGNEDPEANPEGEEQEDPVVEDWVAADFTYGDYEELIYGCDYTRQIIISGKVVTGFSEQGEAKLANRKDLVLPAKDTEGNTLVGVGANAFKEKGLTSVKFPTGMMVSYDDTITNRVSKRGNYVIAESAFARNELTSVYLPSGVLAVMPNAFQKNKITKVTLPRTIWWVETLAFANNEITKVSFPSTTDFLFEMHGMAFADNQITSVTIPDYVEVINKHVFVLNPGMEPCDPAAGEKEVALGGVVYMYTDNAALKFKDRIHHVEKLTESQKSWHQKLIVMDDSPETENPDTDRWNANDFTYDGQTVTGLTESGIAKRSVNKDLVIPDLTPDLEPVTALADAPPTAGGLFATQTEKFDSVRLPVYLKKIGNNAFRESGLEDVVFPEELEEIGTSAFLMNNLSSVILPDSVNSLGNGAFATNPKIERINLSSSLTEIPAAAFGCSDPVNYMPNLTEIEIPDSVTTIGNNAFAGNNFRSIVIPESVTSIGNYAFSTKNYLRDPCTLTLPEGLQTIGRYAFRNKVINIVKLPTTVNKLYANVFLKEYTDDFPVTVTKVYVSDFGQYSDEVNFPPSDTHELVYIGSDKWVAEDFTYGTTTLTQSDYVTKGNDRTTCLTGDIHVITGFSEEGLNKLAINTDLVIPAVDPQGNKVQGIGKNAFKSMGLTSLTLPVTERVEDTEAVSKWDPDATMRGDFFIMNFAFSGNELQTVDIPEGVLFIASGAFKDNKLTSVKLPSSLMVVSSQAFASNTSGTTNRIASVNMPETTDFPIFLGRMSFGMNKIKAVQLPAETIVVDKWAFIGNTGKEPVPPGSTAAEKKGGVVYMYIVDTEPSQTIAHLDGIDDYKSNVQKLFAGQTAPAEDAPWNAEDFTYNEGTVTGLSEIGKVKIKNNSNLVIPEQSPDGVEVTEIGSGTYNGGTFDYSHTYMDPETGTEVIEVYVPTSIIFPKTLKKIGNFAFKAQMDNQGNQTGITSLTFPENFEEIGISAFQNAPIVSLRLPDSVKTLGAGAFATHTDAKIRIESLTLSEGLTEIPQGAFSMQKLEELVIPQNVTSIGRNAFSGVPLKTLVLNDRLTTIGRNAFWNHQLETLVIPASVNKIDNGAFEVLQEGLPRTLSELTLNDGLESIGSKSFAGSILKVVDLPETVTTLNKDAFKDNASGVGDGKVILRTLNEDQAQAAGDYTKVITNGSGHVVEFDNMAGTGWNKYDFTYSEDETTITGWSESGNQKRKVNHDLVLPNTSPTGVTITAIGDAAFQSPEDEYVIGKFDVEVTYGIETVVLPEGLQTIGDNAFEYNSLEAVPLENALQLTEIGTSAFHGNKISNLVIPDTVTSMGKGAFSMNALTELKMSKNVTVIPQGAFSMNIRLDNIKIPDTVTEIEGFAFAGARLTKLEIPASVEKVGEKAFHLHHIQDLTIPGTLKEIGDNAFEGTYKATTLQTLVLEEGIEKIGAGAFKEGLLEEVALPSTLVEMGNEPFQNNAGKNASGKVLLTTGEITHLKWDDAQYHTIKLLGFEWVAVDKVNVKLYGHDDIHASWTSQDAEEGAVKYKVEYKRSTWKNYKVLSEDTTENYFKKANLVDGARYRFKVTPYVEEDGVKYTGDSKYSSYIYTLKKLPRPRVSKVSRNYVRVRWTNIPGESGYQIVRSRYKTKGFRTIRRPSYKYSRTSRIRTTRNRRFYYKIRAYKNVDGKRIYGPWSNLRSYRLR
ncbi:MAG TPA: leucine-rich repeat protein [Mogibacterium sp.]|nr:leucine-rich repeat protein [Mogibacterium sp.]